ncbi:MAG TPA: hypothetical protein HA364_07945 [Thermoplasmata archaeon]|nr:hypothetical protein [Thermoplasmata archaeon]
MAEGEINLESLLNRAKDQEREYDWGGAAETYQRILELASEKHLGGTGDLTERKAHALYKSALQADDFDEFRQRSDVATEAYSAATDACVKAGDQESMARAARSQAMLALLRFFRSGTAPERKKHLEVSWGKTKEALEGFAAVKNASEFCKTYCDLSFAPVISADMVSDYETRKRDMMEVLAYGERAEALGRGLEDTGTVIGVLVMVSSLLERAAIMGLCDRDFKECHAKALDIWHRAEILSREEVLAWLPLAALVGDAPVDPDRDMASEYSTFREAVDVVRKSGDRMMIGHALAGLTFYANWISLGEDLEEACSLQQQALDYALLARDEFWKIGFVTPRGPNVWIMSPHMDHYAWLAYFERDPKKRQEFGEKALACSPERTHLATLSGYTIQVCYSVMHAGNIYDIMARTETNLERKRELIQKAEETWRKAVTIYGRFDSGALYNLGLYRLALAEVQGILADTATDAKSGAQELRKAIDSHRAALGEHEAGIRTIITKDDPNILYTLANSWTLLGRHLRRLSELTGDSEPLNEAISCIESAYGIYSKAGWPTRAAENLWEAARIYDQLENHEKAREMFLSASEGFRTGAEKSPRLKSLYSDLAVYLGAWAEFEKAKHHHVRQEYQLALEHFDRAAQLHESLPKWRFLASNYRAWAMLDKAEALSREDRWQEAAKGFEEAGNLFQKSRASLEEAGKGVENADEEKMIARLLKASGARYQYCRARTAIEKAREMNVEGRHSLSCELYESAANELESLADSAFSDQDRREMELVATLSRAWQRMNQAEAELSSEPYEEAAHLFEEAKGLASNAKVKALALGHSRFCRALEAGTRFTDTRDQSLHATATKHLESASSYYLRAGADTCSEYARASKLLFDAYAFLDIASQEKDHNKAAKAYNTADKVLQASAEAFGKAGQQGKKEQVTKLQEKVKQDKELAVSLMQVLEAPTGLSSTTVFGAPTPTQETAAGLDRFAHADIQATVIGRPTQLNVGEDLSLEIELVNAGRGSAQLTKVEQAIPKGFDVQEVSQMYRVEDSYLNMKGRRLDPLKTEDVRIVLRPTIHGSFRFKPRIMYLDDSGKYRSHEPEPIDITVKELGISGWLKGPNRR